MSNKEQTEVVEEVVVEQLTDEEKAAQLAAKMVAVKAAWNAHKGKLFTGGLILLTNALAFAAGVAVGKETNADEDFSADEDETEMGRLDVLSEVDEIAETAFANS